ncbi:hypothetical protein LCGC14_1599490 [marine sediment metagenome]|uniref:Uncharacterized protein n=1 Tax=marine sediment metagenome TaxID=412755 RepID=A0A0F9IY05_9ZZZZ
MSWFHKHSWERVEEAYAPPFELGIKHGKGEELKELLERASFGVTTIIWECSKCGAIRKQEMLGKVKDANC